MFRSLLCSIKYPAGQESFKWQSIKTLSTTSDFIHLTEVNDVGVLSINRPKAMNSINRDMISTIGSTLKKWENTKSLVIVKSDAEKVFCAGADIRELVQSESILSTKLNRDVHSVFNCIRTYGIPYVALINGITMGIGAGLSVTGKYQVATENTVFAMPETAIGLYTNCGAGHFLPRLPGHLGMYLGLTGNKLKGEDVFTSGLATHFCPASRLGDLESALMTCKNSSDIEATLSKFCIEHKSCNSSLEPLLRKVNKYFSGNTLEDIFNNLQNDESDWSQKQLKILHAACPLSLVVTHRLIKSAPSLAECFKLDTRLGHRFIEGLDLPEGVRAKIIEKDNAPKWQHKSIKHVSEADVMECFRPFEDVRLELVDCK